MRVLVSGASGLVGRALVRSLETRGDEVLRLVRRAPRSPSEIEWDASERPPDLSAAGAVELVVHLSGENVAGRWTGARKRAIRDSRVESTRGLAEALRRGPAPSRGLLCASAIGFYGSSGDAVRTESDPPGCGFLADVCREWETAADAARAAGIRVAHLRFGAVLAVEGGALAAMLPVFRLGAGGRLGSGRQWFSWVAIDDAVAAIEHVAAADLAGPVNVTAPEPVTNAELTAALGEVLNRPTILPAPAFVLRALLGEMADEMLLSSIRVVPHALEAGGFRFRRRRLRDALTHLLERRG